MEENEREEEVRKELTSELCVEKGKTEVWKLVAESYSSRGDLGTDQALDQFCQLATQSEGFKSFLVL